MPEQTNQIGFDYLKSFFVDVEQLNEFCATYKNVLVEIKTKTPLGEDYIKTVHQMDSDEKKRLWFQAQSLRYLVTRIDLKLPALGEKIEEFKNLNFTNLDTLRDDIREQAIPDFSKVEKYAREINKLFVTGIVAKYLESAESGYRSFVE